MLYIYVWITFVITYNSKLSYICKRIMTQRGYFCNLCPPTLLKQLKLLREWNICDYRDE